LRLFLLARHAHSLLNLERRVNGNPAVDVPLTEQGREEARLLGTQVAHIPLDACVHTRFPRTLETARIALEGRDAPLEAEPLLDDVNLGELEGWPIDEYRRVKRSLGRKQPFPGGESLDDAARRYARGFRALVARPEERILVVCHEIPLRYALNAAAGSDSLDGPIHEIRNASPYLFDESALARAADGVEKLVGKVAA
jgi:broad specificity phosphatase PhoE